MGKTTCWFIDTTVLLVRPSRMQIRSSSALKIYHKSKPNSIWLIINQIIQMDQLQLFYHGVVDSLQLQAAWAHYTKGKDGLSVRLLRNEVKQSLLCTAQSIGVLFFIEALAWVMNWVLVPAWVFLPLKVMVYTANLLRQTVYIQRIATLAGEVEKSVFENREFFVYSLEGTKNMTPLEQINLIVKALLFSVILLIQTSMLDLFMLLAYAQIMPLVLLKYTAQFITWLLYSVYISVGLYSLKIPYQDHLPYYFHRNIGYLAGLCFIQAVVCLNFLAFPYLGCLIALLAPFYQLQVMRHDPPYLGKSPIKQDSDASPNVVDRASYKYHLYCVVNQPAYRQGTENMVSWFSIPKVLRPYFITLVKPLISMISAIIRPGRNLQG